MRSVFLRNPTDITAIELHRIELALAIVILVRCEKNSAVRLVNTLQVEYLEITARELTYQLGRGADGISAIESIELEMRMTIPPTWPYETVSRLEDSEVVVNFDPVVTLLGEH